MASIGIQSSKFSNLSLLPANKTNQMMFSPNRFVSVSNNTNRIPQLTVSSSSNQGIVSAPLQREVTADSSTTDCDSPGSIDSWMHDSVQHIVKNLEQAPLLVQIYAENNGEINIHTEKAVSEKWPLLRSGWESKSPDGLIFVEELEQELDFDVENQNHEFEEGVTKAWGIVIQAKGGECGPSCYLLKTNRVCSGLGLGFCTHFCLMRVNNFRDSAFDQFKNSWLLQ